MRTRRVSLSTILALAVPAVLAMLALAAAACGQGAQTAATPTAAGGGESTVAAAQGIAVTLYKAPG